jgi:hypothetical protein
MVSPVLVTGAPRSGTTWVGRMLTVSGELGELYEPFNPAAHQARWFDPPEFYFYVETRNAASYDDRLRAMSQLRYPLSWVVASATSPARLRTSLRTWQTARTHRRHCRAAMVKDPLALFSTPLLADTYGFRPVMLVRHPAAFVSSLVRVDWQVRFGSWLRQPLLMDSLLAPWAEAIDRADHSARDVIRDGALLWAVCNGVVLRWRDEHPDWLVLRHEDLGADPVPAFAAIHDELGLSWSDDVEAAVIASSDAANPTDVTSGDQHVLARDSRALVNVWRDRLSAHEIATVRAVTGEVGQAFYGDGMWD